MRIYLLTSLLALPTFAVARGRAPAAPQKPYVTEAIEKFSFRSIEDDQGGFYLIWSHVEGGSVTLQGQHIDNRTLPLWKEPGITLVSGVENWQAQSDGQHGLILAWEHLGHVSAQRYNAQGQPLWPDRSEVSVSTAAQKLPALAVDGAGGAYIVWEEQLSPNRWVLFTQHLKASGAPLWSSQGMRVSLRASNQTQPAVVYDGVAGIIVGWQDFRNSASQFQAQRINYQGNRLWGLEGVLITAPANDKKPPYIAAVGKGSGVFAWQASDAAADRLFLQSIDASGKPVWPPEALPVSLGNGHQWNPVLHGDGEGGTWIGWEDYRNALYWQVFVQHFQLQGKTQWPTEAVLTTVRADQGRLSMMDDGHGGIFTAWVDNRLGTNGIYLQQLTAAGVALFGNDAHTVADRLTNPQTPQLVRLAPGLAVVTWADNPTKGTWRLYWQRVGGKS